MCMLTYAGDNEVNDVITDYARETKTLELAQTVLHYMYLCIDSTVSCLSTFFFIKYQTGGSNSLSFLISKWFIFKKLIK